MLTRLEYRARLRDDVNENDFSAALEKVKPGVDLAIKEGEILEICLYRHGNMLFLYIESFCTDTKPEFLLSNLTPFLNEWPEENGLTPWAFMYPVYFQQHPGTEEDWVKERVPGKTKIGRIAFLKHETMFEYVYWHKAITDEGLLKGDKYQYISLHEDILFSYYEEPRNNVSISGIEGESEAIKGWLAVNPSAHFDREKTENHDFLVIEPILIMEKEKK